jgi:hypothetical protein
MLKMEAICSSETSVQFQRTTRRYIADFLRLLYSEYRREINKRSLKQLNYKSIRKLSSCLAVENLASPMKQTAFVPGNAAGCRRGEALGMEEHGSTGGGLPGYTVS